MKRRTIATWGILIVLLVSLFGTAAAQTGEEPPVVEPPAGEETELPGAKFFTHPVVVILSEYFDREKEVTVVPGDEVAPEEGGETGEPVDPEAPAESESGLGPIGEYIAEMHEDGMGFGVLVKILSMAEASAAVEGAECPTDAVTPDNPVAAADEPVVEGDCTLAFAQELVDQFKSGVGMGQLFKANGGKPALLGVGHVKQELKKMGQDEQLEPPVETQPELQVQGAQGNGGGNGRGNGSKPPKTHEPKGRNK